MTTDHDPALAADRAATTPEDFTTSEGLRDLLHRLHDTGPQAWRTDPVAAAVMVYAADKYTALARKHGLDPWEAASAAFDVMRTPATQRADDPWAVITHAVRITCIAEERGQGLLCSTHQARRPHISAFHDAERLSERENPLSEYHPAFQIPDPTETIDMHPNTEDKAGEGGETGPAQSTATSAVEDAIAFLALLEWPPETARSAVEHICAALAKAGSRASAYEALRRDHYARALLDLPRTSWSVLLTALLGTPTPGLGTTGAGRGVLLRLVIGETLPVLLCDDDLVLSLVMAAPDHHRHAGGGVGS